MTIPNLAELLATYQAASDRAFWTQSLDKAVAVGDAKKVAVVEGTLADIKQVDVLDSMRAGTELVALLTSWRWQHIRQAREEGRSWAEIGDALGMSKQGAFDLYKTSIERQEEYVPESHEATRSRAVLGDGESGSPRP